MTTDKSLRKHLAAQLDGGHAYAPFDKIIANFSPKLRGEIPNGLPHSAWMLLEHLRLAQRDILDFSRDPKYVAPKWPDDYWPKASSPPSPAAWNKSVKAFQDDSAAMKKLISNPKTDLFAKIPWGDGQTILREALLIADHNAHHLGQMIDIRKLLGIWGT
jgi:DinB superfamily